MSMKYYAVTDDPNELLHYGVKGMKWGQHLFGDDLKPKSAGYKRALGKLRASVKRSSTQRSINRQRKQQDKYNKAVQKAQSNFIQLERMSNYNRGVKASKRRAKYNKAVKQEKNRADMINNLLSIDRDRKYYDQINRDLKRERKAAKSMAKIERYQKDAEVDSLATQARQAKRAAKVDKKFDKVLQKARKGTLKYGNLSEEQVARIQNRLNSEANARKLGSAEKTWHQQKKEARRRGKLSGIEKGTAAIMEEVAKAGAQVGIQHLLDRHKMNAAAKQEGKRERIKSRQKNKKSTRDLKREFKQEVREQEIREGIGILDRSSTFKGASRNLKMIEDKRNERKRLQSVNDDLENSRAKRAQEYLEKHDIDYDTAERSYLHALQQPKLVTFTNSVGQIHTTIDKEAAKQSKQEVKRFNSLSDKEKRKLVEADVLKRDRIEKKVEENLEALRSKAEDQKSQTAYEHNQAVERSKELYRIAMDSWKHEHDKYAKELANYEKEKRDISTGFRNLEKRMNSGDIDGRKYLSEYNDLEERRRALRKPSAPLLPTPPQELSYQDSKYLTKNNNNNQNGGKKGNKKG